MKNASTIAVARGTRDETDDVANAARNAIVSRSASEIEPPTLQCTFSNVTQKSVARNRPFVSVRVLIRFPPAEPRQSRDSAQGGNSRFPPSPPPPTRTKSIFPHV